MLKWTAEMDAAMQQQRRQGANWQQVAHVVGVEIKTAVKRARALGIPTGRINVGRISGKDVIAGRLAKRRRQREPRREAIAPGSA